MRLGLRPENIFRSLSGTDSLFRAGLVLVIAFFLSGAVSGSDFPASKNRSIKETRLSGRDSLTIVRLSRLSAYYCNYLGDIKTADSLASEAVRIAEMSFRPELCLMAYFNFLEISDLAQTYSEKAKNYGQKAVEAVKILNNLFFEWRAYKNMAELYLSLNQCNIALTYSYKAIGIAGAMENNNLSVESYLLFARSLECKMQKNEAHSYFLNAVELADKLNDPALQIKCYNQLSKFYMLNKMTDQAMKFKLKEGDLSRRVYPGDTVRQMWIQWELIRIEHAGNSAVNEQNLQDLISFSILHKAKKLKSYSFALYRTYLIDLDRIDRLYDLYTKQYPGELINLSQEDPEIYCRLKALFMEKENCPDSALFYFNKAEGMISNETNEYKASQFYFRFGQFLCRHDKKKEAIGKFLQSYKIAQQVPYFDYMLNASHQLEILYNHMGDYRNAFTYSVITRNLGDSINDLSKKEQMIMNSINREQQVRDKINQEQKLESEKLLRQKQTERNTMAGVVAFLFILSFVIFRSYRVQKKSNIRLDIEKKRSDGLLLNILPGETAEELKQTGKAKAKYFEEVTVMFTDFKDFTQASEKMLADELVEEIHFYFSEFDRIISKYPIEKIKTIGDSYMCAGGLPIHNETHALDVVNAALELQEFMEVQRILRTRTGKPGFELRIGIHTGPVIAGIVGTRKFAYDIWGDTVNTASRMETSGEPGKVNISGATYEKIKDHFSCIYRGKVQAKHKGLIDMYFASRNA
ncbi:MAG: adenylate/guanylate cyclase domain-containing protein [Bacteroidetes bacterium]|nr:adenylate/guanylate cyclase domain-containing protein [Bacteroidota bacterium]